MKKVVLLSVVLALCAAGNVFAAAKAGGAGLTIDGSLSVATATYSGSGAGLGFGFGATYDLGDIVPLSKGKLLARADLGYLSGSKDFAGVTIDSSRMPLFVGARYVLPVKLPVDLYAEAGLELSFDKHQEVSPLFFPFPMVLQVSETNLGVTPGFGVILPLGGSMSIGADARFHVISNSYTSFNITFGYSF